MKQGTIKTLGVAAVGAAFAVTASGTASAAGTAGTLESVSTTAQGAMAGLPVEQVANLAPAGGPVVSAVNRAIATGVVTSAARAVDTAAAPHLLPTDTKGNGGLLGGLQPGALAGKLPTKGLPVGGLTG
ncbi:ATP-binding protein [Streptomyces syringium]|uniref:ATP-binding protein n=1 Tax=Streptomyces syringium TaxID=76729 RepID=UPI003AAEE854